MNTIDTVLKEAASGTNFYLALGSFLDEFYLADTATRQLMIDSRPADSAWENPPELLAYAASTAHKLANDYQLTVPAWVFEKRFYLAKPFFGCKARGNLRLLFMYISPTEFKHRNLFVDENVLKRV
jgi:hypothetical protein